MKPISLTGFALCLMLSLAAQDRQEFRNPSAHYRPKPLWFWNDTRITREGIDEQMAGFVRRCGYGGFSILPFGPRLAPEYLSGDYFELYRHTARKAAELGVTVKNAVGYSTHAVTETTIGAAIGLRRQILYYDRYVKAQYAASGQQFHYGPATHQLYGSKWGIVGMGNIGRNVARIAEALGCEVRYTSTSGVARREDYPALPLGELLAWADVVSIHAPLTEKTRGLIGARELAQMKPSAILINVARGGIVDEAALAEALDNDRLAGAGLDVFAHEPIEPGNPLLALRNPDRLLLSPHNAWSAIESLKVLVDCIAQNIKDFYTQTPN